MHSALEIIAFSTTSKVAAAKAALPRDDFRLEVPDFFLSR